MLLAGQPQRIGRHIAQHCGHHLVVVVGEDSLHAASHAPRQSGIHCQRALPAGGHPQVLVQYYRRRGKPCPLTLRHTVDNLFASGAERQNRVLGLRVCHILVQHHVRAGQGIHQPHIGYAASEEACAAAHHNLAVAGHVPVEAHTGRHVHPHPRHVAGVQPCKGAFRTLGHKLRERRIVVVVGKTDNGSLQPQSRRQLEETAELHLVLHIDRGLKKVEHILRQGQTVLLVGVGHHGEHRGAMVDKTAPRVEHKPAGTAGHKHVAYVAVLKLHSRQQRMEAGGVGQLVGDVEGADLVGRHIG